MAGATVVFSKGRVTNPMKAILDIPMPSPEGQKLPSVGLVARQAGNGVLRFERFFAVALRTTRKPANLFQAWPIEVPGQTRGGL